MRRLDIPEAAPRGLTPRDATRWLRVVSAVFGHETACLGLLPFYAGLRIGEVVGLDIDDVRLSARKGALVVRSDKGDQYRKVPVHPELRQDLAIWL